MLDVDFSVEIVEAFPRLRKPMSQCGDSSLSLARYSQGAGGSLFSKRGNSLLRGQIG
jgi:hypothetical protein